MWSGDSELDFCGDGAHTELQRSNKDTEAEGTWQGSAYNPHGLQIERRRRLTNLLIAIDPVCLSAPCDHSRRRLDEEGKGCVCTGVSSSSRTVVAAWASNRRSISDISSSCCRVVVVVSALIIHCEQTHRMGTGTTFRVKVKCPWQSVYQKWHPKNGRIYKGNGSPRNPNLVNRNPNL